MAWLLVVPVTFTPTAGIFIPRADRQRPEDSGVRENVLLMSRVRGQSGPTALETTGSRE